MAEVIVDIDAEGNVKVEARQVQGQGCEALTRAIQDAIGRSVSDVKKPEFYQQSNQGQQAKR